MGRQKRNKKSNTPRTPSANSVNYDARARDLYNAGIITAVSLGMSIPATWGDQSKGNRH